MNYLKVNTMVKYSVPALIAAVLSGCSAGGIERSNDHNSKFAPVNAVDSGIMSISYLNQGASIVTNARREDAFEKMYNECSGKYELVDERGATTTGATYITETNTGAVASTSSYNYATFYFRCVD